MLDKDVVEKVSHLARLKLTHAELEEFSVQLSAVLQNFQQIAEVTTDGVRPLVTPTEMTVNLRGDSVEKFDLNEALLQNAPEKTGQLFKVPPVV